MYRSDPTNTRSNDQCTSSNSCAINSTAKLTYPDQEYRPSEVPPELPQVSKEWLASPQNLSIHSTYLSTPRPRTRKASGSSNQRRWSSFIPLPTSTSSSAQDVHPPPPPAYYSSLTSPTGPNPTSSVRPRRRSTGSNTQSKARPQSLSPGPSSSNSNSFSPSPPLNSELSTCSPRSSSYVIVFPPSPTTPNSPTFDQQLIPPKKKKLFKTVSNRLRSIFHPGQAVKHLPRTRSATPNQARRNQSKRHSALVTQSEFNHAHDRRLSIRPFSVIIGGSSDDNAVHSNRYPKTNGNNAQFSLEGDTTLLEEEAEEEENEEVRQINRLKALQNLESSRLKIDEINPSEKVVSEVQDRWNCSPTTTSNDTEEQPEHDCETDQSFLLNLQQCSSSFYSSPSINADRSRVEFLSVAHSKIDSHLDRDRNQNTDETDQAEEDASMGTTRNVVTQEAQPEDQEGTSDSRALSDISPISLCPDSPSGGGSHPTFHPALSSLNPRPYCRSWCSEDLHLQPSVMPILSHSRGSNFPFRRRRASSPVHHDSIDFLDMPSSSATTTPATPGASNSLGPIHSKSSSPCSSDLVSPCPQLNSDQSYLLCRPFCHHSDHFDRFQARMAAVKLRSSTLNPSSSRTFSAGFPNFSPSSNGVQNHTSHPSARLPSPTGIKLSWETAQTELLSDIPHARSPCHSHNSHTQPLTSPSSASIDHNSDSSHLTMNSELSSNKLSTSNSCVSSLPPQIELSLSFHSSNLITGLPHHESSTLPKPASSTFSDTTSSLQPTRPVLKESSRLSDSISTVVEQDNACGAPIPRRPAQQIAPNISTEVNVASSAINHRDNRISSLTSRVRPTPSPRPNRSTNLDPVASALSATSATTRPSGVLPRLSQLPELHSYSVPPNDNREPSESSLSIDHLYSVEDEVADDTQEVSDQSVSASDDEHADSHRPVDLTVVPTPLLPPIFSSEAHFISDEWISCGIDAPSASKSLNIPVHLPLRSSTPEPQDQNSIIATVSSPGRRARLLLLSPSSPPPIQSFLHPRPSTGSRRSQSAVDLSQTVPDTQSTGSSKAIKNTGSIHESNFLSPLHVPAQNVTVKPSIIVDSTNIVSSSLAVEASAARNPISTDHNTISQRHQSMYEFRPPANLPSYDSHRTSATHIIAPREEEGHEALPPYSCAIHFEGWMPRKMEFKSPGVKAKDRSWKRQYVVLHGTMIRIYRSDPHSHPLAGSDDSYSYNFIHSCKSYPLASKCGIDIKHTSEAPPLHFHRDKYDSVPVNSLKEVAIVKAVHQNSLQRVYTLQNAESGLAADYLKRKYIVRVRAEGEQFLLQAKNDRGVIDLIEALQAATNVSLDLDVRPLPKFITLPRRRRRRRVQASRSDSTRLDGAARREIGAAVVEGMIAEAEATRRHRPRDSGWNEETGDRLADMLAEEQEAYIQGRN